MSWTVEFRPEVEEDVAEAASWYEARQEGLGDDFIREVMRVWDRLAVDPITASRHGAMKDIRWRFPDRFPYRVIYQMDKSSSHVLVLAVLHAARHDRHWKARNGGE